MASISITNMTKAYNGGVEALHGLNLDVRDGEFMVLVGPSGCGKTTALRLVAGLEELTSGTVKIGEQTVNDVSARDRDIAMVFQNYALYPHMSVRDNMAFSLKLRGMSKQSVAERVNSTAEILGLGALLDRRPGQLSGGQRQRVAMGRAIVREPAVFLMDEPLSNLDAKLRTQMRAEVLRIQKRLGVSTMYVTHDQTEAMTMGDRVAVLRGGDLQQCDTPQGLFFHPANLFVAAFIGSPAMNLFEATLADDRRFLTLGSQRITLPPATAALPELVPYSGQQLVLGVRPEDLLPAADAGTSEACFGATVDLVEALGSELLVHFELDALRVRPEGTEAGQDAGLLDTAVELRGEGVARVDHRWHVKSGEQIQLAVKPDRFYFFDRSSGAMIDTPAAG